MTLNYFALQKGKKTVCDVSNCTQRFLSTVCWVLALITQPMKFSYVKLKIGKSTVTTKLDDHQPCKHS